MKSNKKKIYKNLLFPPPPGNHYNDLQIDDESVTYITPYELARMTINILKMHHNNLNKLCGMDMTGGVGGDTIALSSELQHVVSVEMIRERHEMMINNLNIYGIKNVFPVCGNSINIFEKLDFIDVVYIDPPWGGSSYMEKKTLRLEFAGSYIEQIICRIFDRAQLSKIKTCVMKLPLNYDIWMLYKETKHLNIIHYLYKMKKMYIIVMRRSCEFNDIIF